MKYPLPVDKEVPCLKFAKAPWSKYYISVFESIAAMITIFIRASQNYEYMQFIDRLGHTHAVFRIDDFAQLNTHVASIYDR